MEPWQRLRFLRGWAAHMPSTCYFSAHLQWVLPSPRQMTEKASFLLCVRFEFVSNGWGSWSTFFTVFFLLLLLFWISLEEFLRTKKTQIISHGFSQSLSHHLTRSRTLGQEWAPQRLAERKRGNWLAKKRWHSLLFVQFPRLLLSWRRRWRTRPLFPPCELKAKRNRHAPGSLSLVTLEQHQIPSSCFPLTYQDLNF